VTAGVAGVEADVVVPDGVGATAVGVVAEGGLGGADEHPADTLDATTAAEIARASPASLVR